MTTLRCLSVLGIVAMVAISVHYILQSATSVTAQVPVMVPMGQAPRSKEPEKLGTFDVDGVRESEFLHPRKPVNGLTLEINYNFAPVESPQTLCVEWEFKYNGPRQPLIIRQPSFGPSSAAGRDTEVRIFAVGKSKKCYCLEFVNQEPHFEFPATYSKNDFVKIPKGQTRYGKVQIPLREIKSRLMSATTGEFDESGPPRELYLKMYYNATARGEEFDYDAWTGRVESNIVPFNCIYW